TASFGSSEPALKPLKTNLKPPGHHGFRGRSNLPSKGILKAITMSTTADSYVSLAPRSVLAALASTGAGALRWLLEKVLLELEVRRALREIERFDDNMLHDIGLARG